MIFADEWKGYTDRVGSRYVADYRIRHEDRVYVSGERPHPDRRGLLRQHEERHPWRLSLGSSRWLPSYLNEYTWRYNERSDTAQAMFRSLVLRAARPGGAAPRQQPKSNLQEGKDHEHEEGNGKEGEAEPSRGPRELAAPKRRVVSAILVHGREGCERVENKECGHDDDSED